MNPQRIGTYPSLKYTYPKIVDDIIHTPLLQLPICGIDMGYFAYLMNTLGTHLLYLQIEFSIP